MKHLHLNRYIAALLIPASIAGSAYAIQAKAAETNDAIGATKATVTMNYAVDLALQKVPGTAVSAKYEDEGGRAVWEVEVLATNSEVHDLKVDAASGDVLKDRIDQVDRNDDDEDKDD
jgi:uncharacterized membrane protein YkoI